MDWNKECGFLKGYLSEYDKGYQDGRKETAEKILKWFKENYSGSMLFINSFFKEQFGVEIEEC